VVNASLNWASIVGIVLAVGGALLYFMRSFKPALARDYDVFFAAVGLLCGGILIFQGWRLDPILQFGQFLLAGTTVFFAYESVRLRSVTTEQARRSSYFDDDEPPARPRMGGGGDFGDDVDRFDEPQPVRRRIPSRDDEPRDDFYRQRRQPARAAIPERAASRRGGPEERWDRPDDRDGGSFNRSGADRDSIQQRLSDSLDRSTSRFRAGAASTADSEAFGARRRDRDTNLESRRGSRPSAAADTMPRSSRRPGSVTPRNDSASPGPASSAEGKAGVPQGTPLRPGHGMPERKASADVSDAEFSPINPERRPGSGGPGPGRAAMPRDNSSRFDD
jgi:hypothetical protein